MDRGTFYGHLLGRCAPGTTEAQVHEAWCCILTGMPPERAELVAELGTQTRLFLLSNTNALHAAEFERIWSARCLTRRGFGARLKWRITATIWA